MTSDGYLADHDIFYMNKTWEIRSYAYTFYLLELFFFFSVFDANRQFVNDFVHDLCDKIYRLRLIGVTQLPTILFFFRMIDDSCCYYFI